MIGMTDLVLEGTLAPEQREYLQHARGSADQLMAVVNDVLDLSKLEAERVELEHTPFALRETLESALRTLTPRAHGKGLELLVQVADDLPDTVLGDPVRLQQVLVNLLGNAVKFTAQGGITLTVAGAPTTDGSLELQVDVCDTGIGIAPERIEQLFEPYTQAERSTTREYGGTGLGLNICRRLVGLMGGHLWAESMPGEGSTFHFTLRLGTTVDAHALPTALPVCGGAALVVDDHEGARTALASELQSLGLHVTTATDGPSALAEVAQAEAAGSHFDLVFVDHAMPGMDGATLLSALRLHPQVPGVTVLMVSPGSPLGEPAREDVAGIAARISKPLLPAAVREVAVQVLGRAATQAPTLSTAHATRALEVLVAEDDPVNRKLAVTLLHKHGHRVTVANDGREACAWLDRRTFDLVLMDMHMPDVDGFAATEAIRLHEAETGARRTPIVALTALATDEDRARCLAVGMDGHTHKPLRMAELMSEYGHLFTSSASAPAPVASVPVAPRAVAAPAEPARLPAYDRAQLERNVDGDLSLMRELVDAFVVSHGEQVNALQSALTDRRVAEALRAAHSLKGMLLTLAATEAAQVAYDMELSLRAHEVEHAVARMPELAVELERLVIDLGGDERRAA
jgi:CheY-like chemotaxis protein